MISVVDRFLSNKQQFPERPAYIYLDRNADEVSRINYGDFYRRACDFAAGLDLPKGARVVLHFPTEMDFVVALWGCLLAGCVVVPVARARSHRDSERLATILTDIDPDTIVCSERCWTFWQDGSLADWRPRLRHFADVATSTPDYVRPTLVPDDLAIVQYTSGTTGVPKGVCISHGNLFSNAEILQRQFEMRPGDLMASWLPHFHDMGLIGKFAQVLFVGSTLVFMEPLSFLARPINWLRALHRYRACGTAAPNFAYDLCTDRIAEQDLQGLDLSHVRFAINGSEIVREDTLTRFAARFASIGLPPQALAPAYGMAETTLFVGGKAAGHVPDSKIFAQHGERRLVHHGYHSPLDIRIVDPDTTAEVAAGEIGEIWLRGPNISPGYWQKPHLNAQVFGARIHGGEGPFFRSGDLGLREADGGLFIAGRVKDLIIVRGRNFFPQDIETAAEAADPCLRTGCGAAFALDIAGQECAVLVQELEKHAQKSADLPQIAAKIRMKISAELGLDLHTVVFVRQGSLPTTSSGKIQRGLCRERFITRELALIEDSTALALDAPVTCGS